MSDLIRAAIAGVDEVAVAMESKWGVGQLIRQVAAVSPQLAARFERQKRKFDDAIVIHGEKEILEHSEAMKRGWQMLDKFAIEHGREPLNSDTWELKLGDGTVVVVCKHSCHVANIADNREVWSLEELAKLIEEQPAFIRKTKQRFPGAVVTDVREDTYDWSKGDEIPF
ncbi:MAG: hypothetical protein QGG19_19185 [Alphaproteobacteria bacterium]|nr:hypothetical protein [Alphaproteobacteria bacterium]